jgi:hypothetical protein
MLLPCSWPIVITVSWSLKEDAMSDESRALADKVISSFQELLDSNTRAAVGDGNFHALQGMVIEALAEQSEAIIERLQQDLNQVKADMVGRLPLEL